MTAHDNQYALDTARAKTPGGRLRIIADMEDAHKRGEELFQCWPDGALTHVALFDVLSAATCTARYVTKRRPAIVIPALELFDGAAYAMAEGKEYFVPDPCNESGYARCVFVVGHEPHEETLQGGCCFRTPEGAAAIGLHIRNALAQAVAK